MPILEAQAAALSVISTIHTGIPDIVIQNETGLLCVERDVEAMTNNMLRILEENGLAKRMGEAGRKRVKENFTMERYLKNLVVAIENAISNRIEKIK